VYLAAQQPLQVRYVGLTRQLVGRQELNAPPYTWCGSIGPMSLETRGEILARRVGTVLAHRFGLKGLFGCDFVVNPDGEPMLTEVNPRYTGSTEVLELLCGATLLADHCVATGLDLPEDLPQSPVELPSSVIAGKAVLYSDRDLIAPDSSNWDHVTPGKPLPGFADLPQPGSVVRAGGPFCSVFAAAHTFDDCESQLLQSAASVRSLLESCPSPAAPVENPPPSP
jgi:predicted ATP-grasp superfamily ATP-dependent carboligase